MLRLIGKVSKRFISGYISSDSEAKVEPHLKGVVVRSLPQNIPLPDLESELKKNFSSSSIDIKQDVRGKPAYAVLKLEKFHSIKEAMRLNKSRIFGKKMYISVMLTQPIASFINDSPALGSGHDARKVVLLHLNNEVTEDNIYEFFSSIGNVMELKYPRDYDVHPKTPKDKALYREVFGAEKIDLTNITSADIGDTSFISEFRAYGKREIDLISDLAKFKGNNTSQVFAEIYRFWDMFRKFKDVLGLAPSELEKKIEDKLNRVNGQKTGNVVKVELLNVLKEISKDFNEVIDEFYARKSYALITFATRNQAERAMICNKFLNLELKLEMIFDRELPHYFYCDRLVSNAYYDAKFSSKPSEKTTEKREILILHHHMDKLSTKLEKFVKQNQHGFDSDEMEDPLVMQSVKTEEEGKELVATIEGIQDYGSQKREKILEFSSTLVEEFSESDELLEDEVKLGQDLTTRGRLYDKNFDYTKHLMKTFLISSSQLPLKKDQVKSLLVVPETEHPREIPPKFVYASLRDKVRAKQKVMGYQRFFNEVIPSQVSSDPSLLRKEQYGDFPNIRYVYEPEFDYYSMPEDNVYLNKRKETMEKLRERIRDIVREDKPVSTERIIMLGKEEKYVKSNKHNVKLATDSDEEKELEKEDTNEASLNDENEASEEEKYENEMEKEYMDEIGSAEDSEEYERKVKDYQERNATMIENMLVNKSNASMTHSFKYTGDENVDKFVEDLNKFEYLDAVNMKNEIGDDIVHVVYKKDFIVTFDQLIKLYEKYGEEVLSGKTEIMIDEEDVEIMNKINNSPMSWQEIVSEAITELDDRMKQEKFEKGANLERIHRYGQFVTMLNESEDEKSDESDF